MCVYMHRKEIYRNISTVPLPVHRLDIRIRVVKAIFLHSIYIRGENRTWNIIPIH